MKVRIDFDRKVSRSFEWTVEASWWHEIEGVDSHLLEVLQDPLSFRCDLGWVGQNLLLSGELQGELYLTCGRCLERYRHAARETFRLLLESAGGRVPVDPDGASDLDRYGLYLADELDLGWFQGNEIELDGFLYEAVALIIPVQPLCREECGGLCATCGANQNLEGCACATPGVNSAFGVLRGLREQMEKEEEL